MTRLANILLTAALVAATSACRSENTAAAAPAPRPPSVAYVSVAPEQVEITGEWIATLDGTVNAQIRPQVSGYLVRRAYNEGAFVHKGDVLLEIDRRPFETALNQVRRAKLSCRPSLTSTERSAEVGNRRVLPEIDSNIDYGGHGGHPASMVESFQPSWLFSSIICHQGARTWKTMTSRAEISSRSPWPPELPPLRVTLQPSSR